MASSTDGSGSNGKFSSFVFLLYLTYLTNFVGTLSRNYSLNSGSPRDYETLKQQYDKANNELNTLRRRCDHAMKVPLFFINY